MPNVTGRDLNDGAQVLVFLVYGLLPVVVTSDQYDQSFTDIESVVRVLLEENKDMKIRIQKLEHERVDDRSQIERLKNRINTLEDNYFGKSDKTPEKLNKDPDSNHVEYTPDTDDETASSSTETPLTGNDNAYSESTSDSNVALKQSGISSSGTTPLIGQLSKRAAGTEVAFHVYLSGTRCYSNHEIFKFDREPVDVGGGFNTADGIYDAPATGLYVFTWTVAAPQGSWFAAELIVNGAVTGVVITDSDLGGSGNGVHPSTGVVLANVNAGDHVFIRFVKGASCYVESDAKTRTSFSGWLLI